MALSARSTPAPDPDAPVPDVPGQDQHRHDRRSRDQPPSQELHRLDRHSHSPPGHEHSRPTPHQHNHDLPGQHQHNRDLPGHERRNHDLPTQSRHNQNRPTRDQHSHDLPAHERHSHNRPTHDPHNHNRPTRDQRNRDLPPLDEQSQNRWTEDEHSHDLPTQDWRWHDQHGQDEPGQDLKGLGLHRLELPGPAVRYGPPVTPQVALSTASVYPEPAAAAFEIAADLGYDGVELMVWGDPVSQDPRAVQRLVRRFRVPVLALHAPCLAVTQRVWTADPIERLRRSVAVAEQLEATTVVLHPPFRWQRRYADQFPDEVAGAGETAGVRIAVENMFPLVRGRIRTVPYTPGFDPTEVGHAHYTLDLSHTAAAGTDATALLDRMGAGLIHLHLTDGSGRPRDEHLVPGRGTQPCAEVCRMLAAGPFAREGLTVLEVSTRRCRNRTERVAMLRESLDFARDHLRPPATLTPR